MPITSMARWAIIGLHEHRDYSEDDVSHRQLDGARNKEDTSDRDNKIP